MKHHNHFGSNKKKEVVHVAQTHNLDVINTHAISIKKKSCLCYVGSNSRPSYYSTTLYHTETAPVPLGGQEANKLSRSHKQTSWEHNYVGLAQAHPKYAVRKEVNWNGLLSLLPILYSREPLPKVCVIHVASLLLLIIFVKYYNSMIFCW